MSEIHVLFVRHGESVDNVAKLRAGSRNSPLSAHGVVQARRLGAHLASRKAETGPATHIFSSNLDRAFRTAEAILEAQMPLAPASATDIMLNPEILQLEELREKDFGSLEGTRGRPVVVSAEPSVRVIERPQHVEPESFTALTARATRFVDAILLPLLEELVKQDATQSVVVVAHGIIQTHVWSQFITAMKKATGLSLPRPDSKPIELAPSGSFLANTGYHEVVVKRQTALARPANTADSAGGWKVALRHRVISQAGSMGSPFPEDSGHYPPLAIFPDVTYRLSWTDADPNFSLQLAWYFPVENRTVDSYGRPSLARGSIWTSGSSTSTSTRWTFNISGPSEAGFLDWKPSTALADFPNVHSPNISSAEAAFFASNYKWSGLGLTQPEKIVSGGHVIDFSPSFILLPWTARSVIAEQEARAREDGKVETRNTWKLAVGVGVGLGVPFLTAAAGLVGYLLGNGSWGRRGTASARPRKESEGG